MKLAKGAPTRDEPAENSKNRGQVQNDINERELGRGSVECPPPLRVRYEVVRIDTDCHGDRGVVDAQNSESGDLQDHACDIEGTNNIKISRESRGKARVPASHSEHELDNGCEHYQREHFEHGHARHECRECILLAKLRKLQQKANRNGYPDKSERPRKVACCFAHPAQHSSFGSGDEAGEIGQVTRQLLEYTF